MGTGPERASLRLPPEARALSMDQCRGFAIVMMLLGNFMGHFAFMPSLLTHHRTGMTLAETIAPLFVFLVGMSHRGAFLRRTGAAGLGAARGWAERQRPCRRRRGRGKRRPYAPAPGPTQIHPDHRQ